MDILYNLLIQPLVVVYDVLYTVLYGLIENSVLTILAFSIVINFLALPLYRKADLMQREELEKARKMRPWLTHIRKHFSGDERFMMTQAYYKVERYNPLSVIKEAGPLLLQIPFFIAAYRYVSNIPMLAGASFGPIPDLLAADGLLNIGGVSINILPIIMTVINCISGYIYSKGGPLRQKIQIYGVAAVFLVLLYNSASGLVIYWIMNQIFSLCKNIVYTREIKNKRILPTIGAVVMIVLVLTGFLTNRISSGLELFLAECILLGSFALIIHSILTSYHVKSPAFLAKTAEFLKAEQEQKLLRPVLLTELCLFMLMGVFIPSTVLSSSVSEFTDKSTGVFQTNLLCYPAMIFGGLFLVWMTVIIFARDGKKRRNLAAGLWIVLGIALVNQFFFDPHVGVLYSNLIFDKTLHFGVLRLCLNILVCVVVAAVFLLLFLKRPEWMKRVAAIICIVLLGLSIKNIVTISSASDNQNTQIATAETDDSIITLSRNGKNVVVIMLDRAIGGYAPFIFDEKPELKEAYQGFVYYPNTVSFGAYTNFGSPALFGGYEYTPTEMNKRNTELLKDKHNEALKLMPVLFSDNGYRVTVCDPPYAGYQHTPDLSIYSDYSGIDAYNLSGRFTDVFNKNLKSQIEGRQGHNFVIFSLFRTVPLFMKDYIYDNGNYLTLESNDNTTYTRAFLDQYSVLDALPSITAVKDDSENCFLMFQNATPHEPVVLSTPDYQMDLKAQNEEFPFGKRTVDGLIMEISDDADWKHYCVNVASYLEVGKWLDYLKEQGVYDNTRIIIASDHGRNLGQFEQLLHPDGLDIEYVWPLLMVKDFNARETFSVNNEFMTNADVPTLAMQGVIKDPINLFTGNPVNGEVKKNRDLRITDSENFQIRLNNGTTFDTSDGHWWTVHDSIFDMNNWKKLD